MNVGCTAWIIGNGKLITAGHCLVKPDADVVEFNVPASLSNGTVQHPGPEDQYIANENSFLYHDDGIGSEGNDYGVFEVFANSATGLLPKEAQNSFYVIKQTYSAQTIRITGFGVDDGVDNQTQQTNTGPYEGHSGNFLKYEVDTKGGNSGSPIIDETTGFAIGVHTDGFCQTKGYNGGTSFYNSSFWQATGINGTVLVDQKRENGARLSGTYIGRCNGSSFSIDTIQSQPIQFDFSLYSSEVLRADQGLVTGPYEKYNRWLNFDDVKNHREFFIDGSFNQLTSQFNKIYSGVTIKNAFPEVSGLDPSNDNLQFKDPWFIDYPDPSYGNNKKNRGMYAPFISRTSPFNPDYSTSYGGDTYKGVFLNEDLNFLPNIPNYSVQARSPQTIHLSQTGKDHKFYFLNWSGTSVNFKDANADSTGAVFTSGNAAAQAILKGTQLSNSSNAFANNGQRKFVRTDNGKLFLVYESIGKVWLEGSTDNGATWTIKNGGKPLSTNDAKNPSMALVSSVSIAIVFQEKNSTAYKIKMVNYQYNSDTIWDESEVKSADYKSYSDNANPVVYYSYNQNVTKLLVIWSEKQVSAFYPRGLYYRYGHFTGTPLPLEDIVWENTPTKISGTSQYSINPALVSEPLVYPLDFYLVWEQSSAIKYCTLSFDDQSNLSFSSIETPSSGNGYTNSKPSIGIYSTSVSPVVAWIIEEPITYIQKVQLRIKYNNNNWGQFWIWHYGGGDNIYSANINNNEDGKFVLAWGGDDNDQYLTSHSTTNVYNLSTHGDIQVANAGTDMSDMKINSFDRYSSIKDFTTLAVTSGIYKSAAANKSNKKYEEIVSKGLVLTKDSSVFMFDMGGIEVDGKRILFSGNNSFEPDSTLMDKNEFETESFLLTDNSNFSFKTDYYSKLSKGTEDFGIKFKVELIDAESGNIVQVLGEENKKNHYYKDLGYNVNTNGIGNRKVKMRLLFSANGTSETEENVNAEVFTSVVKDSAKINKENFQQITLKGDEIVKDYALFQNYPNPFNPSTIISYQIPKAGFVTLKIYDMLGKEVTTLVNEYETKGRYNINFNASNLSSGVYLYKLKVNDFSSTKKLILMK